MIYLSVSLLHCHVHTGGKVSKYTHYTHKVVDKAFYSFDKVTVSLRVRKGFFFPLTVMDSFTAAITCASDETDQHHKLIEVDLVVAVEVERFQQLIHFLLVLRTLNNQEKETLTPVV